MLIISFAATAAADSVATISACNRIDSASRYADIDNCCQPAGNYRREFI